MPVLANIEVIWVIIVIVSVIAQIVKSAKKGAAQAPGKATGAGESPPRGTNGQNREFVAPDEALQDFLRTLSGEKPAAKTAAASPVQAISRRRGLSQSRAAAQTQPRPSAMRDNRPPPVTSRPPAAIRSSVGSVQDSVVLEKFAARKTSASILGEAIRKDLSDAQAIRKAIVLREVLGPPVALRG